MTTKKFCCILAFLLITFSSGFALAEEPVPTAPGPVAEITTTTVQSQQIPALIEVVGTLQAVQRATIAAKISGTISSIPVVLGSRVEQGELLVRISAKEIGARLKQAEAHLLQAKRNLEREQNLLKKNATTSETVKSMQDQYNLALATYNEVETMQGYTTISAPFTGVITQKTAHAGDLATPGQELLRIENNTQLQVQTAIPESLVLTLSLGDELQVHIPAAQILTTGVISEVAPAADPASRTAPILLDLPQQQSLRSGQFARVMIPGADHSGLYIPRQAIHPQGQMDRVFVVENNQVHLRLIRQGMPIDDMVEILSGLNGGEQVVVTSSLPLYHGQPVRIVNQ